MKRWLNRSAIGSVVFLVALYLVLFNRFGPERWHGLVWKMRRPGQMSVVEALAMEMEAMKPPEGVLPVATEIVKPRRVCSEREGEASAEPNISANREMVRLADRKLGRSEE